MPPAWDPPKLLLNVVSGLNVVVGTLGVVRVAVDGGVSAGLGVCRGRRGGRNSKYGANKASQNITRQFAMLGMP